MQGPLEENKNDNNNGSGSVTPTNNNITNQNSINNIQNSQNDSGGSNGGGLQNLTNIHSSQPNIINQTIINNQNTNYNGQDLIKINDLYKRIASHLNYNYGTYSTGNMFISTLSGDAYSIVNDTVIDLDDKTIQSINKNPEIKKCFESVCNDRNNITYEELLNFISNISNNKNLSFRDIHKTLKEIDKNIQQKYEKRHRVSSAIGYTTTAAGIVSSAIYLLGNPEIFNVITMTPGLQWALLGVAGVCALYLTATRVVNLIKTIKAQSSNKTDDLYKKMIKTKSNVVQGVEQEINNNTIKNYRNKQIQNSIPQNQETYQIPGQQFIKNIPQINSNRVYDNKFIKATHLNNNDYTKSQNKSAILPVLNLEKYNQQNNINLQNNQP